MSQTRPTKEYRCERCGKAFTSSMRLQHHLASEHAVRTLKDIRTSRDISHDMRGGSE